MEDELWRAVFKPDPELIPQLDQFLMDKLRKPNRHYLGHASRIIIEAPDQDEIFKCSEWFRHNNPAGEELLYTVTGYAGMEIKYLSFCEKCRKGEDHRKHLG